jgi:RHS repeat-associated protein
VWGPANLLLATVHLNPGSDGWIEYHHHDHLGSNVLSIDDTGQVLACPEYTVWGAPNTPYRKPTYTKNPFIFTGVKYDVKFGCYPLGVRDYDPQIKRFLNVDPVPSLLADLRTFNAYVYAFNDPVTYIDPKGTFSTVFDELASWSGDILNGIRDLVSANVEYEVMSEEISRDPALSKIQKEWAEKGAVSHRKLDSSRVHIDWLLKGVDQLFGTFYGAFYGGITDVAIDRAQDLVDKAVERNATVDQYGQWMLESNKERRERYGR